MDRFDKKIKESAKNFQVPDSYNKRVDETLESIQSDDVSTPRTKIIIRAAVIVVICCLVVTASLYFANAKMAEASFMDTFKHTIMDFLGLKESESKKLGIESEKKEEVSKPELFIELQEVVMDSQSMYALIKITAPANMEWKEGMTFDYFGCCEGSNYNASKVVSGSKRCTLLEVLEDKKNVAAFVLEISTHKQIKEGKEAIFFFKDLIAGQYEDTPDILVEGMWSISFTTSYTDVKDITIKGTKDMEFPFADTTAKVKKIKLLPLGMTLVTDASKVSWDTLNTTDTRFVLRFRMIDGSEIIVSSPRMEDETLSVGGEIAYSEKNGKKIVKYVYQFEKAIDINQVLGIYIADYYIPIKEYE